MLCVWTTRFASAFGRKGESHASKYIELNYAMWDEADDILTGFRLIEEAKRDYDVVKTKIDGHFVVRRTAIFERAKFNRRSLRRYISRSHCRRDHRSIAIIEVAN